MIRTQLILDERTYAALRSTAFRQHHSLSAMARELLRKSLGLPERESMRRRAPTRYNDLPSARLGGKGKSERILQGFREVRAAYKSGPALRGKDLIEEGRKR